jgi:hypothetical protein
MESYKLRSILIFLVLATFSVLDSQAQQSKPKSDPDNSGARNASSAGRVVIKVGNQQVTEEEFETRIKDLEPEGGDPDSGGQSEKDRRDLGEDYASVLMLSQKAEADHLDATPEIRRQLEIARLQVLSDAEFAKLMREVKPTPDEISAYYNGHSSDFEEVQVRRLFIWKGSDSKSGQSLSSQDAHALAEKIQKELASGADPAKVSAELKDKEGGMLDASLLTFPRGELSAKMEKVAFRLSPGQWGDVEDTPESLISIQLVERNTRPLQQVTSLVENQLQSQKMKAKLDDLKTKSGVWLDQKYFSTAAEPESGSRPKISKSAVKTGE